jgi:tetratricopeptide (TPR) repeat protein
MYLVNVYHELGETGRAIQVMEECLRLAEQAQFVAPLVNTRAELGKIYASMGLLERGRELVNQAMEYAGQYTPPWFPWVLTEQAQLHILLGEFREADLELERARRAIQTVDPIGLTAAVIPMVRSQLALAQKDYPRVLAEVDELEPYRVIGVRTYLPDVEYRRGKALFGLGRVGEAREVLNAARREAETLGSRRTLWPILKALGDVERVAGDLQSASRHWHASAEIVEYISARIDDEELKAAFLRLPEVQEVYRERDTASQVGSKDNQ